MRLNDEKTSLKFICKILDLTNTGRKRLGGTSVEYEDNPYIEGYFVKSLEPSPYK